MTKMTIYVAAAREGMVLMFLFLFSLYAGVVFYNPYLSMCSLYLTKVEVAGSNPVSRSIQLNRIIYDSGNITPTFTKAFTKRAVMRVGVFRFTP